MRRHLVLLAVLPALTLALAACGDKKPSDPRSETPLVRAATVRDSALASRSFTGTVAARVPVSYTHLTLPTNREV